MSTSPTWHLLFQGHPVALFGVGILLALPLAGFARLGLRRWTPRLLSPLDLAVPPACLAGALLSWRAAMRAPLSDGPHLATAALVSLAGAWLLAAAGERALRLLPERAGAP